MYMNECYLQIGKVSVLQAKISSDSKLLYGAIQDRISLSYDNGWVDETGVFCLFTRENMAKLIGRCRKTITKCMKELKSLGLIIEKRQGLCKPNKIYLGVVAQQMCTFDTSKCENKSQLKGKKVHTNKPKYNKPYCSNNNKKKNDDKSSAPNAVIIDERDKRLIDEYFVSKWLEIVKQHVILKDSQKEKLVRLCLTHGTEKVLKAIENIQLSTYLLRNIKVNYFIDNFIDIYNGERADFV